MKIYHLLFLLSTLLFMSCEFEESNYRYNLGADFIDNPNGMYMIDTLTVNTYTTTTDSVVTSRQSRLLAGRFENKLGVITSSEAYFRLDPSDIQVLHESSVFDSACFIFYPDGYHFGDTTKVCDLAIYPLTQPITPNEETEYIYNVDHFSCEPLPVAVFSMNLSIDKDVLDESNIDSIMVRVSDTYGKIFYDMVFNEDTLLEDKDDFTGKFMGYVIKPANSESSFIIGFNATADSVVAPKLRIYYHDYSEIDNQYLDYSLEDFKSYEGDKYSLTSTTSATLNPYVSSFITNDYRKSVFNGMDVGEDLSLNKLSSNLTSNVTLLQSGLDLRTRIEIPYIDNLYPLGVGSIVKAILYIKPMEGSFSQPNQLLNSLELFLVDRKNRSYGQMMDFDGETAITSSLSYNSVFKDQTYYIIDITRFLRDEYMSKSDPEYSLQLACPRTSVNSTVDQLILESQNYSKDAIKLILYVTNYSNFDLKQ